MNEDDQRIRERAYKLWQEEGCPEGRAAAHWDMARELIAIEENQLLATKPNPMAEGHDRATTDEPVEPIEAVENQGDFPGLTDQGERNNAPGPRRRRRS